MKTENKNILNSKSNTEKLMKFSRIMNEEKDIKGLEQCVKL